MTKKLYSVDEILEVVPLSIAGIYKAVSEGKIPSVRVGRRVFVPAWWIDQLVNEPEKRQ